MKHKIKTSIMLTAMAIAVMHIINKCISSAAIIKHLLRTHSGHLFEWRFGKIFYTKSGQGTPLLLIHDLTPQSSSYEWSEVVKNLSKDHTVYTIDLLGCGRSDKPNLTYTNFLYVQLITDFIQQVIGQKTDVAATGFSSSFVIMACHNDSELFHNIFMINPEKLSRLNHIPGKRSKMTKLVMELPIVGTIVYNMIMNKNSLEYLFTEEYIYNPFRMQKKYVDTYYESSHLGNGGGKYLLASLNGSYINANINHALKAIDNSIVIISGGKNSESQTIIDSYTEINPAIESVFVNDSKMLPQLEMPNAFIEQLQIFK